MAEHVCPVWVGYLLASPIRRLAQKPEKILGAHVREGMTVLEVGPGMGFFSLPLARLVGPTGRVIAVDVQEKMLQALAGRARKAGLSERIETRGCRPESLGLADLAGRIDFALAFAVVHEVDDQPRLMTEIAAALRPGGRLLLAEPAGHVSNDAFAETLAVAQHAGLSVIEKERITRSHAALLGR